MVASQNTRQRVTPGALAALVIVVILAACAAAPASSASPDEPDASSPAAEATASGTPLASESSAPSIAADADLAALLPTTVAGRDFTVTAYSGEDAGGLSFGRVGGIATGLEVAADDVDAAIAVGPDWDPNLGPEVLAIRYPGADSAAILDAVARALGGIQFTGGLIEVTEASINGKAVSVMEVPMMSGDSTSSFYFYAISDVVFIVTTSDRAEAEDALSQLP